MESPICIRQVQLADVEELAYIEGLNFSKEAFQLETLKELMVDTFLIADLNGEIAGYIIGSAVSSHSLLKGDLMDVVKNPLQSDLLRLQRLSVHPSFQRQGIGTLLIASLKEMVALKEYEGILLSCTESLLSYYEMNGFVDIGLLELFHSQEPCFEMIWENPYCKE